MRTKRFPEMADIKPEPPKITDERVAEKIANAIYDDLNIEDCYWTPDGRADVIDKMVSMIIKRASVGGLFWALYMAQPKISDSGERGAYQFGYEGVQNYPDRLIVAIAKDILDAELTAYEEKYKSNTQIKDLWLPG